MAVTSQHPKLVIFDAFNTLVRPAAGFEGTFAEGLAALGVEASPEIFAHLQSASSGLDHRRWSRSREDYAGWTRQTLQRRGQELIAGFASDVIPALEQWHQAPMEQFDDVAECLAALRSAGITIATCSNWGWDLADDLAAAALAGSVDIVVTSAEAGCRKPHPDIYSKVLKLTGIGPAEALFVGDSIEADVLGPQRIGIKGILLERSGAGQLSLSSLADLTGYIPL
jgi:putative hydrolase of the HAD superfamily